MSVAVHSVISKSCPEYTLKMQKIFLFAQKKRGAILKKSIFVKKFHKWHADVSDYYDEQEDSVHV